MAWLAPPRLMRCSANLKSYDHLNIISLIFFFLKAISSFTWIQGVQPESGGFPFSLFNISSDLANSNFKVNVTSYTSVWDTLFAYFIVNMGFLSFTDRFFGHSWWRWRVGARLRVGRWGCEASFPRSASSAASSPPWTATRPCCGTRPHSWNRYTLGLISFLKTVKSSIYTVCKIRLRE